MNKCILVGRLTKDPETRVLQGDNGTTFTRFSIAVNRRFKNKAGVYEADFPNCICYGKTAEFVDQYFKKGMVIGVTGRLITGSYTNKDGKNVYTTDVVIEEAEFVESKSSGNNKSNVSENANASSDNGFMNVSDEIDEELPFA